MSDNDPLDAEVVWEAPAGVTSVPDLMHHAPVRMLPTGDESWWRLYSTPTSPMRSRQEHGIRAVTVNPHNDHIITLEVDGWGLFEVTALAWRVNAPKPALGRTALEMADDGSALVDGIESLDLLVHYPPKLPDKPRQWQQMTQPGQLVHPGDDRDNWQYVGGWTGGHGVRFTAAHADCQAEWRRRRWHQRRDAFERYQAGEGQLVWGKDDQ